MALVRCRHCHALDLSDATRCSVCGGADPSGQKFALLGSLFLGGLVGAAGVGLFAAGLWWKWHRWARFFGDPDEAVVSERAADAAMVVGGVAFLLGSLAAATLIHKSFRFR
ncbi:MAG TPA: hypothetical protein VM533_02125 [Fimbriiglobus sp.]|jgi:hypothetical protein|nr:hypothetical protein [Fimbriiglobus sp.]